MLRRGVDQFLKSARGAGRLVLVVGLLTQAAAIAHPDLLLQIERLDREISVNPGNPELWLQRGDLYRRHGDWARSERDFLEARRLAPGQPDLPWFYGRMLVEAGRPGEGEVLLTRYLELHPSEAGAFRTRAVARNAQGRHAEAADDFRRAIEAAPAAGPSLYRDWALALLASGPEQGSAAAAVLRTGEERFPMEMSLRGLHVDVLLSRGDAEGAASLLQVLPTGVSALPQWEFRSALEDCLMGNGPAARAGFALVQHHFAEPAALAAGTWTPDLARLGELAASGSRSACQSAAGEEVRRQLADVKG